VDGTTLQVTLLQGPSCMWKEMLCGRQPINKMEQIRKKKKNKKSYWKKNTLFWLQPVGKDGRLHVLNNCKNVLE